MASFPKLLLLTSLSLSLLLELIGLCYVKFIPSILLVCCNFKYTYANYEGLVYMFSWLIALIASVAGGFIIYVCVCVCVCMYVYAICLLSKILELYEAIK